MPHYWILPGKIRENFSDTAVDDRMMALSKEEKIPDRMIALSKEETIPDRMMDLFKEERIELVLLSGREGWSYRKIAEEFNLRHPYRQPIYFTAVGKLINKFKETGSVLDKPRSERRRLRMKRKRLSWLKFLLAQRYHFFGHPLC
ncbi:KEOPS complex subunit TP53RK isoform X1 [Octopus vulgaris]|uniref:KEOPS complex subunit TP53RK isoform X1 n=1 Tax=Octopus vulgaris TaxID=6645 RepID=A0AA36B2B3_OCTVU|nr:KEOPS complex subunit TP53RK isoform X1 [Octopus vulgaris]